jgi:hypothetical protein
MKMTAFKPTRGLRLSLAILSLASASTVLAPRLTSGDIEATGGKCDCGAGPNFCKSITVKGVSVSCYKN